MTTMPFSLVTGSPALPIRVPPSEKLAGLKSDLERLLKGSAYLVRFSERKALCHEGGFKEGSYFRQNVPALEVYRLNDGLPAPLLNPDTVVATFMPMYVLGDETGTMSVAVHDSREGNVVVRGMMLDRAVVECGYWYKTATPQP